MNEADPLALCVAGQLSPEVTLARLLLAGLSAPAILHRAEAAGAPALVAAARRHEAALDRSRAMLRAAQLDHTAPLSESAIAAAFDRAAGICPDAAAALYTLGDPATEARASAELVAWLRSERAFSPGQTVLDLGCGAGRLTAALAAAGCFVVGTDISAGMLRAARTRPGPARSFLKGSGRDLACLRDGGVDFVLAADSFPYLMLAGPPLAERHVAEAARILRPGGTLAILNFSYRNDAAADRADAGLWCARHGLTLRILVPPLRSWDATAYLARK